MLCYYSVVVPLRLGDGHFLKEHCVLRSVSLAEPCEDGRGVTFILTIPSFYYNAKAFIVVTVASILFTMSSFYHGDTVNVWWTNIYESSFQ